jgi:hypothetical protein
VSPELPWAAAAVFEQARRSPDDPWLFFRPELDWRWRSWSEVARAVAAGVEALAAFGPGARVAFEDRLHPDRVAFDLAVQGSGHISVPLPLPSSQPLSPPVALEAPSGADFPAVDIWFVADPSPSPGPGPVFPLPLIPDRWEVRSPVPPAPALKPGAVELDQTVELDRAAGPGQGREREIWLTGAVAEKARNLPAVEPRDSRTRKREILVCAEPLGSLQGQVLVAWSALTAAALLLEPEPAHFRGTVQWSRPTVLAGRAAQLAAVRRDCGEEAERRPWWRRGRRREALATPLDRVRAVWVLGDEALAEEDLDFWQQWSVPVTRLEL